MLPFPIINQYGNIIPRTEITSVQTSYNTNVSNYILRSNGELWGGGYNSNGQLGLGNTNDAYKKKVLLLRDDVKLLHHSISCTFILTKDNKFMYTGEDVHISSASSSKNVLTWTSLNSRFSGVDFSKVIAIGGTGNNAYVLLSTGELYSTGYYEMLGINGTTGNYSTTPTFVMGNVKSMQICTGNRVVMIKNDGTIWAFGNNGYGTTYAMDVNTTSYSKSYYIKAPVQLFSTFNTSTAKAVYGGQNNNLIVLEDGITTIGNGSPYYGTLGMPRDTSGTVGYLSTDTVTHKQLPSAFVKQYEGNGNSMCRYYRGLDGIYGVGYNWTGSLGVGFESNTDYSVNTWTKLPLPIEVDLVKGFGCGYFVNYLYTADSVYMAGQAADSMSTDYINFLSSYKKITLPF